MARPDQADSAPSFESSNPEIDHQLSDTQLVATDQNHQQQAQPQPPQSSQNNSAVSVPMQPVQFPPQNSQTVSFGTMQPVQYPPQVPQNSLLHFTHPGPIQLTTSHSVNQPTQYPMQPAPNNYHFHSINIQPSVPPVHFLPVNEAHASAQSNYSNFPPFHQVPVYVRNPNTVPWTTGLFDCMDDPWNALVTLCIPCVTFGQVAEIVDNGTTSCATSALIYGAIAFLIGCPCFLSCTYRTKLRSRHDLIESPAPDWVTHFLCEYCALCQEYRELQKRGLDPSLGWHANVARNPSVQLQYHVAMVPPTNQHMMG